MLRTAEITGWRKKLSREHAPETYAFRALGDRRRCQMCLLIARRDGLCVTEIASIFEISVPAASHQLKILERAGLVEGVRVGQTTCYHLNRANPVSRFLSKTLAAGI